MAYLVVDPSVFPEVLGDFSRFDLEDMPVIKLT